MVSLPKPRLRLVAVAFLVMALAVVSGISPAGAQTTDVAAPSAPTQDFNTDGLEDLFNDIYGGYVPCGDSFEEGSRPDSGILPIERWGGATSGYHTRLGAKFTDDIAQRLSRDVVAPIGLVVGNSMWQMSAGLMDFASNFAIIDTLGCQADKTAAGIGNALNGAVVAAMAVAVLAFLWRRWKTAQGIGGGAGGAKSLIKPVLVLCLFAIMLNGANTTAERMNNPNAGDVAGTGSPKWIVDSVDKLAANVIDPIVAALGDTDLATPRADSQRSCADYVEVLHGLYAESGEDKSPIPLVMSRMWEQSGLQVWAAGQFGLKNEYGSYVYCHLLERNVHVPFDEQEGSLGQRQLWQIAYGHAPPKSAPKVLVGGSNTEVDQRTIMLAQCAWTGSGWEIRGDWSNVARGGEEGDHATPEDCAQGFASDEDFPGVFDFEDKPNYIAESTVSASRAADFLYNFHGDSSSTAISTSVLYAIASLIMLVVMGGLAMSVILAKLAVIVLMLFTFVMLVAAMIPGNEGKEAKYFKYLAGAVVYSYLLTLILSVVVIITQWIVDAGAAQFGAGSFMSILTMTFAPIAAVVIVNMVAKNFLGAPSLLKPTSGLAFAATVGGAGAAVGVGADRMFNRARSRASREFGRAGAEAKGQMKDRLAGGKDNKVARRRRHGFESEAGSGVGTGSGAAPLDDDKPTDDAKDATEEAKDNRSAKKWDREGRGQYDDKNYLQRRLLGTRDRAVRAVGAGGSAVVGKIAAKAEDFNAAWHRGAANPVRSALAATSKGVKYGAMTFAAVSGGVPLVATYGLHKANQARKSRAESPVQRGDSGERNLDAYREYIAAQRSPVEPAPTVDTPPVGTVSPKRSTWDDVPDEVRERQATDLDGQERQRGRSTSGWG